MLNIWGKTLKSISYLLSYIRGSILPSLAQAFPCSCRHRLGLGPAALVLPQYCPGADPVQHWYWPGTDLILPQYCPCTAVLLPQYWSGSAPVPPQYCPHTDLAQPRPLHTQPSPQRFHYPGTWSTYDNMLSSHILKQVFYYFLVHVSVVLSILELCTIFILNLLWILHKYYFQNSAGVSLHVFPSPSI